MALSIGDKSHYLVKEIVGRHFLETDNSIIDEVLECVNNEVWNKNELRELQRL